MSSVPDTIQDWFIEIGGEAVGPYSREQIEGLLQDGEILPDHRATASYLQGQWISVSQISSGHAQTFRPPPRPSAAALLEHAVDPSMLRPEGDPSHALIETLQVFKDRRNERNTLPPPRQAAEVPETLWSLVVDGVASGLKDPGTRASFIASCSFGVLALVGSYSLMNVIRSKPDSSPVAQAGGHTEKAAAGASVVGVKSAQTASARTAPGKDVVLAKPFGNAAASNTGSSANPFAKGFVAGKKFSPAASHFPTSAPAPKRVSVAEPEGNHGPLNTPEETALGGATREEEGVDRDLASENPFPDSEAEKKPTRAPHHAAHDGIQLPAAPLITEGTYSERNDAPDAGSSDETAEAAQPPEENLQ